MSKQQRLEKAARRLALLEDEYRAILVPALRSCAKGYLGLFNQNNYEESLDPYLRRLAARLAAPERADLMKRGAEIESLRAQLVMDSFPLHQRFLAYYAMRGPNMPGETKLAQAFLAELDEKAGEEAGT
jgi:hypothetical protein